jgi:hypothetical protein
MKLSSRQDRLLAVFVGCWLLATGWGIWRLTSYALAPGTAGVPPPNWPASSTLARNAEGFTVVVALHPECPCSQATVEELDAILTQTAGRIQVRALFVELPGLPGPVEKSALWQRASHLAGVSVRKDPGGVEARRFGMSISGETRLYGADGALLFHGGITGARGHAGDNPGQRAVVAAANHRFLGYAPVSAPVFGCELWNEPAPGQP